MPLWVPLLVMAAPLAVVAVVVAVLRRNRRVSRRVRSVPAGWVRAPWPGVVTAEQTWTRTHSGPDGSSSHTVVRRPTVTYRPATGGDVTFASDVFGTWMPRPGAAVAVLHDPADPTRARIAPESIPATFRRLNTVATVFAVIVLVPLVVLFEGVGWFLLTHR